MPPRKRKAGTKKSPAAGHAAPKKKRSSSTKIASATGKNGGGFQVSNCHAWFGSFSDKSSGNIEPEGMVQLCEELGVSAEDVVMLVLAWRLNAKTMGTFTWEEWLGGMSALACDSTSKLKAQLPMLRNTMDDPEVRKRKRKRLTE